MNDRERRLLALGDLHAEWVARHQDTWRPTDAVPGEKGSDYGWHAVDRSADGAVEAEFAEAATALYPNAV